MGGVAFIIYKKLVNNIQLLESVSPRVCFVVLKLNKRVGQAYASISSPTDEEVEAFYEDVAIALFIVRTYFIFITGNFKLKIGRKIRRERICHYAMNSFSGKHRK